MKALDDSHRVVGRLAPSPTGVLHVGNARSLMWAWLSARAAGGRVLLRVEDLIPGAPEHITSVIEDLLWLGLDWDEPDAETLGLADPEQYIGPRGATLASFVLQSARSDLYRATLEPLRRAGLVYSCVCTRKDIANAGRAPHAEDRGRRYPGSCRGRFSSEDEAMRWEVARSLREGRSPLGVALRMRASESPQRFVDRRHGTQAVDVQADSGDFVVRKKDDLFAYMFAVVVDDLEMGVTEVIRGDDLLECTGQQLCVYHALMEHTRGHPAWRGRALTAPQWEHVPLILGSDGRRLAKRNSSLHIRQLAADGVSPRRLRAWIADSMGLPATGDLDALLTLWPQALLRSESAVFTGANDLRSLQ